MSAAPQDEVIADSEDDESYCPLDTSKSFSDVSAVRKVGELSIDSPIQTTTFDSRTERVTPSGISSFTLTHIQIPGKSTAPSTISSFSSKAEGSSSVAIAPKPRPKPRPAYKGAHAASTSSILNESDSADGVIGRSTIDNASIFNPGDSISFQERYGPSLADRAKMRSRNTKATKSTATPSSAKITSNSKPKSNTTTKSKHPKAKPLPESEVINITSSEDELAPTSLPKSNLKAEPKTTLKPIKGLKTTTTNLIPDNPQSFRALPDSQRTITTIPILSSSILPPSDPPSLSTILVSPAPSAANNDNYKPGIEDSDADLDMSPPRDRKSVV